MLDQFRLYMNLVIIYIYIYPNKFRNSTQANIVIYWEIRNKICLKREANEISAIKVTEQDFPNVLFVSHFI